MNGGVARHAFLRDCGLPDVWGGRTQWTVLQTAFGTGLEFLAAWQVWQADARRPGLLHFVAVEARPVTADAIVRAAQVFPDLQPQARELAAQWFGLAPGVHRFAFAGGRVLLTLAIGDWPQALKLLDLRADLLIAGGGTEPFTPADVARLCGPEARVVPGPASDEIQTLLERIAGRRRQGPAAQPTDCVVIGAGLAGAAAAASLARRGWRVRVLDRAPLPAAGASALPAGLMAVPASADDNLLSRLTRCGIRITLQQAATLLDEGRDWAPCGVLERDARAAVAPPRPDTMDGLAEWTTAATTQQRLAAGLPHDAAAWWHKRSAWIRPAALVRAWLATPGVEFQGDCPVHGMERGPDSWRVTDSQGAILAHASLVVIAAALDSAPWLPAQAVLRPVRGQVSFGPLPPATAGWPATPVNGNGHLLPRVGSAEGELWLTGSSYGRGDADTAPRAEDRQDNLRRLHELLPQAAAALAPQFSAGAVRDWSGVRCVANDRRPLVGEIQPGLWVSTAMGSRGLSFAALAGELIAARLHGEPLPLERRLARALDVARLDPAPRAGLTRA
jgi:tRNA 5-methylaminomethyl-2-thiouridine biosynthesis bifunctional protein